MSIENHYRHVKICNYETTHRDMLRASTDELIARGYAKILEEDELEVLAQYHYEKFRNYMAPLFREEGQEVEDKYKTLQNKIATGTLGITRDIEDASDISRQFGESRLDNDVTEDKLRHILLGGLTAKRRKGDPLRKSFLFHHREI